MQCWCFDGEFFQPVRRGVAEDEREGTITAHVCMDAEDMQVKVPRSHSGFRDGGWCGCFRYCGPGGYMGRAENHHLIRECCSLGVCSVRIMYMIQWGFLV